MDASGAPSSFRACGLILPAQQVVFNPTNDVNATNLNATMQYRLAGRGFNDPLARGVWVDLEAGWTTPGTGDSTRNTTEVALTGLTLGSNHWLELALGVRKTQSSDANSRAIFQILPALKYT